MSNLRKPSPERRREIDALLKAAFGSVADEPVPPSFDEQLRKLK